MSSRGFAFNPLEAWAFETDPDRVPYRVIRVRRDSPPGRAFNAQNIADWKNPTGAGVTFSAAETKLHRSHYKSHALVVGELIPQAAGPQFMDFVFAATEQRSLHEPDSTGLRGRLKWVTLDNKGPRCAVVRLIDASPPNFYLLVDKGAKTGLCRLRASPGEIARRRFIAFYNEWYDDSMYREPLLILKAIREKLDRFCGKHMQELFYPPEDTIGSPVSGPQPGHEANIVRPQPIPSAESCHTRTPVPIESSQSSDGPQIHKDPPRESTSSQKIQLRECLAHLFKVDVEYTHDDAVNVKQFYDLRRIETYHYTDIISDLAILLRNDALKDQYVPTALRACVVGEWFRRFDSCGVQEWETERVMGHLAAELCDV
ncbi:hypothetical protein IF1G_07859 [Cordyceps javanica]|uniref:Uncharacterized protein n=1 Tax=Cordyceps javanica TaxID=43265 RepID=A0A545UUY4_9HYPO|nr:hypothetical protein IF1G_07859 [Cordyceps javanica]